MEKSGLLSYFPEMIPDCACSRPCDGRSREFTELDSHLIDRHARMTAIPSLQVLCVRTLIETSKSVDERATLVQNLRALGNVEFEEAMTVLLKDLSNRLELLLARYGEETAKDILGEPVFFKAMERRTERLASERLLAAYRLGSPVEPQRVSFETREDGTFPYEALKSGVAWPAGVEVSRRESYLNEEEFRTVFGMSKPEFNACDKIMRQRLKKEKLLW